MNVLQQLTLLEIVRDRPALVLIEVVKASAYLVAVDKSPKQKKLPLTAVAVENSFTVS